MIDDESKSNDNDDIRCSDSNDDDNDDDNFPAVMNTIEAFRDLGCLVVEHLSMVPCIHSTSEVV